jgi:glycosyltransferase involved in cell wall biosynthesis
MFSEPLVSAIMPTRARREMAARALAQFLEQTWPAKELIIVDDADDPSFPVPPSDPSIVYVLIRQRRRIGPKRNLACSRARGEIILHWDSDDLYAPDRIEHQVKHLISSGAEVVGFNSALFLDTETNRVFRYNGTPGYAIGVSLCYWRRAWERHPFSDALVGEDKTFQKPFRVATKDSEGRIVATCHAGNTSRRELQHHKWEEVHCA